MLICFVSSDLKVAKYIANPFDIAIATKLHKVYLLYFAWADPEGAAAAVLYIP